MSDTYPTIPEDDSSSQSVQVVPDGPSIRLMGPTQHVAAVQRAISDRDDLVQRIARVRMIPTKLREAAIMRGTSTTETFTMLDALQAMIDEATA